MKELLIMAIPSLLSGIMLWWVKGYFARRDRREDEREETREDYTLFVLRGITASLSLGQATADIIERETTSMELSSARTYASEIKGEINNFIFKQGAKNIK